MAKVLYEFKKTTDTSNSNTQIMTVNKVLNGEAESLIMDNGTDINSFVHASTVPFLNVNDKVIVQEISGSFIITDKLRTADEGPKVGFEVSEDGSLSLFSDVSIILKTSNAKIDITPQGKIIINGNEVYSISNGVNRIQGTSIELN